MVQLNLDQLVPNDPEGLRKVRIAKLVQIRGKGKTERIRPLSKDARNALADYLENERSRDVDSDLCKSLFLSTIDTPKRKVDGRLNTSTVNRIVLRIGQWCPQPLLLSDKRLMALTGQSIIGHPHCH